MKIYPIFHLAAVNLKTLKFILLLLTNLIFLSEGRKESNSAMKSVRNVIEIINSLEFLFPVWFVFNLEVNFPTTTAMPNTDLLIFCYSGTCRQLPCNL